MHRKERLLLLLLLLLENYFPLCLLMRFHPHIAIYFTIEDEFVGKTDKYTTIFKMFKYDDTY